MLTGPVLVLTFAYTHQEEARYEPSLQEMTLVCSGDADHRPQGLFSLGFASREMSHGNAHCDGNRKAGSRWRAGGIQCRIDDSVVTDRRERGNTFVPYRGATLSAKRGSVVALDNVTLATFALAYESYLKIWILEILIDRQSYHARNKKPALISIRVQAGSRKARFQCRGRIS